MEDLRDLEDLEDIYDIFKLWSQYNKISKQCKKKKRNRIINKTRKRLGYYVVTFLKIKELDPQQFFINTRMTVPSFEYLLSIVSPHMKKRSIREPIGEEQRLALTLLFLSQACSFQSLAWSWKLGKETVRCIIYETCNILWHALAPLFVSEPNSNELEKIANDFWVLWDLPNCIGAFDGMHVAVRCPPNTSSEFYCYKKFHSINLMAACDAKYTFTYVDVGAYRSQSDGGVFQNSCIGRRILSEELVIPPPKKLPHSDKILPHFFVADAAFPLHKNIMKPFPGQKLSSQKNTYNKRISRARRIIENSFGVLMARWAILQTTLKMFPSNAESVVLACIALHNFLQLNSQARELYMPPNYVDWEDENNIIHDGLWRADINSSSLRSFEPCRHGLAVGRQTALHIRNQLLDYVTNEEEDSNKDLFKKL